jgi:hypothetical protein
MGPVVVLWGLISNLANILLNRKPTLVVHIDLAGTGIRRNPEEFGVNTGILV